MERSRERELLERLDQVGLAMEMAKRELQQSSEAYRILHGSVDYYGRRKAVWAPLKRAKEHLTIPSVTDRGSALRLILEAEQQHVEKLIFDPYQFPRWDGESEYYG